jgi:sugar-specific transcriptional regulator TrmB
MVKNNSPLSEFFRLLDFSPEETAVYLALSRFGTQTTLELARRTGISRTQVYRIVSAMKDKGTAEEIVDEHRTLTRAVGLSGLKRLIAVKEESVRSLHTLFPTVSENLTGDITTRKDTQVKFYRGKAGIMQMVWHTLDAGKEIVGYTHRPLEPYLGIAFMTDWRDAFMKKGLVLRDIYSDRYLKAKKEAKMTIAWPVRHFPSRIISEKLLDIPVTTDFYNDVSAVYTWLEGEVYGVEIINAPLSRFHRQIFEIIWKMGKAA